VKATLIKLDTRVVDIPENRPFWRELEHNGIPLEANYVGMDLDRMPMMDVKATEYRLVEIRGGRDGENGCYMVNDDMWYEAMPILEDIVQKRLRPLEKENMGFRVEIAKLSDKLRRLERLWFVRIYYWIKTLTTSLKEREK